MSMFDYVKGEFKCPECGIVLDKWQTKEYECSMDILDYRMCDYFYNSCPNCKVWIDIYIKEETLGRLKDIRKKLTQKDFLVEAGKREDEKTDE